MLAEKKKNKPYAMLLLAGIACLGAGKAQPTISDDLIAAIIQVESSGDDNAIGDNGKAEGPLQIHRGMVEDCNRIAGEDRWTTDDRTNRAKATAMFRTYSRHYAKHHSDWSNEGIARRWNGGPKGHKKAATEGYWVKVRTQLEGGAK
jgi:soluble lytic murein transglycosylase-like protein